MKTMRINCFNNYFNYCDLLEWGQPLQMIQEVQLRLTHLHVKTKFLQIITDDDTIIFFF